MRCHLQISSYRIDLMSVNGPISPKQCYHEIDYSFYSFYWLDSLEIRLDHNSTYYRSLSKNSDVKPRISHCDSQNLQYKTHPEFWPSHRRIFKTSLYYKTRLILETRRYLFSLGHELGWATPNHNLFKNSFLKYLRDRRQEGNQSVIIQDTVFTFLINWYDLSQF